MFAHFRDQAGKAHRKVLPQKLNFSASKSGKGRPLCLVSDSRVTVEPTAFELAKLLQADGWKVTVLDLADYINDSCNMAHFKEVCHNDGQSNKIDYVMLRRTFKETNWFLPMQSLCVYQWLKNHSFDVVMFQHGFGAGYYSCVAHNLGLSFQQSLLVTIADTPYAKWLEDSEFFPSGLRTDIEIDFFERQTVARSDVILTTDVSCFTWMAAAAWELPESNGLGTIEEKGSIAWGKWLAAQPIEPKKVAVKGEPKISVCIATYNRPNMLREALQSLMDQTTKDFEVVVVDDGSADVGVDALRKELAPIFKKRKWQWDKQKNQGPAVARNHAVSLAKGTHVLFMDDDNVALPDEVEILTQAAKSGAVVLTSIMGAYPEGTANTAICARFPKRKNMQMECVPTLWLFYGACLEMNAYINTVGDTNFLIRADVFKKLGGFAGKQDTLMEDLHLLYRVMAAGHRLETVPEVLMLYRTHNDNRSSTGTKMFQSNLAALKPLASMLPPEFRSLLLGARAQYNNGGQPHPGRFPTDRSSAKLQSLVETTKPEAPCFIIGADNHSFMQSCVTLASLFSSGTKNVKVYVISALSRDNTKIIQKLATRFGHELTIIPVNPLLQASVSNAIPEEASAAVLDWHLFAADYLPKLPKAILLSGGIFIRHDLQKLWGIDLKDMAAGAVSDFMKVNGSTFKQEFNGYYFNKGMILANLNAWRTMKVSQVATKHIETYAAKLDLANDYREAALNKAMATHWLPLLPKWNCISHQLTGAYHHYGLSWPEADAFQKDPSVRQFVGDEKPWLKKAPHNALAHEYQVYIKLVESL